jgi:hypothetical protein
MRGALALALLLAARASAAEEVPVHLRADVDPSLGAQITLELRALGHPVDARADAPTGAASITLRPDGDALVVTLTVPGHGLRELRLRRDDPAQRGTDALRVVETLRALLLHAAPTASPAVSAPVATPPAAAPPSPPWYEALRVGVGAGALVSPGGASPQPTLSLRLAWEGPLWAEALGRLSLAEGAFDGGGGIQTHFATVGVGAPLSRGSIGALGVTLRSGVAWVQARGDAAREGVVAVVEGAVGARLRIWRRVALTGSLAMGSALASVRVRAGARELGEWGRPYLDATIGLSY